MARNYIELMSAMLCRDSNTHIISRGEVATILSRGLSQATTCIINSLLRINSHSTISFGIDSIPQLNGSPNSRTYRTYELSEVISGYCQLPSPNCSGTFAIQSTSQYYGNSVQWTHPFNDKNWVTAGPGHFVDQSLFLPY